MALVHSVFFQIRHRLWKLHGKFQPGWNWMWGREPLFFIFIVVHKGSTHAFMNFQPGLKFLVFSARAEISCRLHGKFQPDQPGWKFIPGWKSPCNQPLSQQEFLRHKFDKGLQINVDNRSILVPSYSHSWALISKKAFGPGTLNFATSERGEHTCF